MFQAALADPVLPAPARRNATSSASFCTMPKPTPKHTAAPTSATVPPRSSATRAKGTIASAASARPTGSIRPAPIRSATAPAPYRPTSVEALSTARAAATGRSSTAMRSSEVSPP